jgi:hypothetical protein
MYQIEIKAAPAKNPGTVLLAILSSIGIYDAIIYLRKVSSTFPKYLKFHETRCVSAKGEDTADCEKFAKYYTPGYLVPNRRGSLCPVEWMSDFCCMWLSV